MLMSKPAEKKENLQFIRGVCPALPERRCEILDGKLRFLPSPGTKHQRISIALAFALLQQLNKFGTVLAAPCDVWLSRDYTVQPDLLFVCKERSGIIGEYKIQGPPDLVIEILSEGTRTRDLGAKRKIYSRFGVPEYWVIDPDSETVEVLVWSEIGYVSAGSPKKHGRLRSPCLRGALLPVSEIFKLTDLCRFL
jgi:Uma2 family endonuclease